MDTLFSQEELNLEYVTGIKNFIEDSVKKTLSEHPELELISINYTKPDMYYGNIILTADILTKTKYNIYNSDISFEILFKNSFNISFYVDSKELRIIQTNVSIPQENKKELKNNIHFLLLIGYFIRKIVTIVNGFRILSYNTSLNDMLDGNFVMNDSSLNHITNNLLTSNKSVEFNILRATDNKLCIIPHKPFRLRYSDNNTINIRYNPMCLGDESSYKIKYQSTFNQKGKQKMQNHFVNLLDKTFYRNLDMLTYINPKDLYGEYTLLTHYLIAYLSKHKDLDKLLKKFKNDNNT